VPDVGTPSAAQFSGVFETLAATGAEGVVAICGSSSIGASFQAAVLAAERLAGAIPVQVVDSRATSMALGLQVAHVARAAQQGGSFQDLSRLAAETVDRTNLLLALDSMDQLRKIRRVGGIQARIATWLEIKPIVTLGQGTIISFGHVRGREAMQRALAEGAARLGGELAELALVHGAAPDTSALAERVSHLVRADRFHVSEVGPAIGVRAGQGALGVAWRTNGSSGESNGLPG
jgi:DegV family protein with EDD domain